MEIIDEKEGRQIIVEDTFFHYFVSSIKAIEIPDKFTYPFCYEPHPLSLLAANELQHLLSNKKEWQNGFGPSENTEGMGKMFGVLVVKNKANEIGYLAAFSGKLLGANDHEGFVPPVFDLLKEDGFYKKSEEAIVNVTSTINLLELDEKYLHLKAELVLMEEESKKEVGNLKNSIRDNKYKRNTIRLEIGSDPTELQQQTLDKLNNESASEKYRLKDTIAYWKKTIAAKEIIINEHFSKIESLKVLRKEMSYNVQKELFNHYSFLNAKGDIKDLNAIFEVFIDGPPPSGAGECAAPKLLQYAYKNNYRPICMAEFWWGPSPLSEVRKHGLFYPSCKSKCEPILGHMLEGLAIDDNPLLLNPALGKQLEIVYEDDVVIVVNKPAEFLSVPGINIKDSVFSRMKEMLPKATGPLIVHRLDMSTSGLMLIAKNKHAHKYLQRQFIKRTIKKRYTALLEGEIQLYEGTIELPLRLDLDNRPTQLVDFEFGKGAVTNYKVVKVSGGRTLIHLFPMTGRTHQLRVHAAHILGLNAPIVGDDLYGKKANRLHLHAAQLEFMHPITKRHIEVTCEADWS